MTTEIDDLIDRLGELEPEERRELSRKMHADWLERVTDAQRAYLDLLEEENLVGGGGTVFQPIPGEEEEWIEYCREHPNDPICLAGTQPAVGDRLSDFLDIREDYLSHLEEEGLVDVEAGGRDGPSQLPVGGNPSPQPSRYRSGSPVGLTPPPDPWPWPPWPWPPEWPPWPWPGPRPDPWPYADNGDPVPLPASRGRSGVGMGPSAFERQRFMNSVGPRRGGYTPGSGAARSPVGLTPPPDPWPPEWPPWPWPGPFPFGGNPIPLPATRW